MQFDGVNNKEHQHSLVVFFLHMCMHRISLCFSMGACVSFLCGGSWLGCQDLPAMGEVSIWELATNSGSSWMFQAPNLHLGTQLLIHDSNSNERRKGEKRYYLFQVCLLK